jgi:hypothetical protein
MSDNAKAIIVGSLIMAIALVACTMLVLSDLHHIQKSVISYIEAQKDIARSYVESQKSEAKNIVLARKDRIKSLVKQELRNTSIDIKAQPAV